ncbi:hypothetical protein OG586_01910 [Streptomyces murinus]|uniref:hypothetical protein n=1 Tax=Streptomyces murinus TaxID=33900 RepID=UPI002E8139D8|nr:hypothetical protein [Streptomyces murinus]WUD05051.1 hypothetical protein OG586_01910 [Streptomyces murinus]
MWPGEQPPGGGQKPQQPPVEHQPNPYQQAGYHQPNPYQQPQPWNAPTQPAGAPVPPPTGGGGGRDRTKLVAVIAAAAVVVAAGVTGFVLLGGDKHDRVDPGPTPAPTGGSQQGTDNPRGPDGRTATVKGWKVVTNPAQGIAFDVPPQWKLQTPDWVTYVSKNDDPDDKPLIGVQAPASLQPKWCSADTDKDGTVDDTALATAGSRRNNGARSTAEIAGADPRTWVFGAYTQPDETKVKSGTVEPFTTTSGLKGDLGSAWSAGVKKSQKCVTDGKAWTFAFKNAQGDLVSWSFFGAKGVSGEVTDQTVRKIAATVRLYKPPSDS